jgi:MoxR-like ATPase
METRDALDPRSQARALLDTVRGAMVEVERPARLALATLLAEGHVLLEDVPGVGKTTLARTLARALGGHDSRIQCTPDLETTGVVGGLRRVRSRAGDRDELELDPGPIFANAVVLDELNRARPTLQSALLEAMEERHVTIAGTRHPLPRPFFCVATMNPHDRVGTFALADAQRDRFAMRLALGYASERGELALLEHASRARRFGDVDPILAPGDVVDLQRAVSLVVVPDELREALVRLVRATRRHPDVLVGASPRALLSSFRCLQALTLLDGADQAGLSQLRELAEPCLAHRLRPRDGADGREVVAELLEALDGPARTIELRAA